MRCGRLKFAVARRGARLFGRAPLIDLMSLRLAIPGGLLSSRARFRFTNRDSL